MRIRYCKESNRKFKMFGWTIFFWFEARIIIPGEMSRKATFLIPLDF